MGEEELFLLLAREMAKDELRKLSHEELVDETITLLQAIAGIGKVLQSLGVKVEFPSGESI